MRPALNIALKQAIVASRRKQKSIARAARIEETRLSRIVSGRRNPTPTEIERLPRVLGHPVSVLFPQEVIDAPPCVSLGR